jgi:hypothetical protein
VYHYYGGKVREEVTADLTGWTAIHRGRQLVASLFAFFDESGKFRDHYVISFCGVLANFQAIEDFSVDWGYWLRRNGLKSLAMKQALRYKMPLSSRVKAIGIQDRITALIPFVDCIKKHLELAVGFGVDVATFKALPSEIQRILGTDPHYLAVYTAMQELLDYASSDPSAAISLVLDDEEKYSIECYKLFGRVKRNYPQTKTRIPSIGFANDELYPPLQAADMIASLTRHHAQESLTGNRSEFAGLYSALMTSNAQTRLSFRGGLYTEDALHELSHRLQEAQKKLKKPIQPLA